MSIEQESGARPIETMSYEEMNSELKELTGFDVDAQPDNFWTELREKGRKKDSGQWILEHAIDDNTRSDDEQMAAMERATELAKKIGLMKTESAE